MKKLTNIILVAGIFGALLAVVNYFSHYPVKIEADEPEVYGEPFLRSVESDVALVVDTSAIRAAGQSGRFSQTDWSYGWMNLLLQEERRFDILNATEVVKNSETASILIVTQSAAQSVAPSQVTTLYELPEKQTLTNLTAGAIQLPEKSQEMFLSDYGMPLVVFPLSVDTTRAKALWSLESVIVLAEIVVGGSRILVSGFNFGALAVRVQQGLPNDDFTVTPRITKKTGFYPLVSGDLAADSAFHERFEPFFDRFEKDYWMKIAPGRQRANLFKDGPRGAFVVSHDEEGMGDLAAWQPEQEQRWGVKSNVFVSPAAITKHGVERMISAGAEVGLHPDQYSYFRRPGLPGLRPFRVEVAINEQQRHLQGLSPDDQSFILSRNHWLLWEERYTAPLRKLAAAGVRFDLSYGPLGEGLIGYIFGTAFPFVPLDTNGFPLPILELPFLFQDDERFEIEYLARFTDTSAFTEEIVNGIFHSNTMGHSPDTLIISGWRESFIQAEASGLPIKQYGDILTALREQGATVPEQILR